MASPFARLTSFFKAKGDAPKLPMATMQGFGYEGSNGTPPPARVHFDALYYAVKRHEDTNACFRVLMNGVGKAGYDFASTIPDTEEPDARMVAKAEQVLKGIDGTQSMTQFLRTIVLHTNAVGNDYWVILRNRLGGEPIGLAHLHPKTVRTAVDPYGTVKAYLQIVGGNDPRIFQPDDVIHFTRFPDPEDDVYAMGPLQALVASAIVSDQKAAETNLSILNNDMKIPMIFVLDDGIGADDFERVATELRQQYSGYRNSGKALVGSGIKNVQQLTSSFSDMQFLELRRLSTEKVCATLGVPKSVIGVRDSANEATAGKVDRITVYEDTIRPQEEAIAETINTKLFPKCGIAGIQFEFNYSSSAEAEIVASSTRADLEKGVRTINEVRYERGLDPYDTDVYPNADEPMAWTAAGPIPLKDLSLPTTTPDFSGASQAGVDALQKALGYPYP